MSRISLTSAARSNLLSLQQISQTMGKTQTRLATGKKVNSAIDNPGAYYAARSLNNRANDLSALLDSMGQKIQTIKAANEGIMSATGFLEQMTSVAEQVLEQGAIRGTPYTPKTYPEIFDGRSNTQAIVAQLGDGALAAKATTLFYAPGVAADDATFGQGKWYLPSMGELMEVYGYDAEAITSGTGASGMTGENKTKINNALSILASKGVDAAELTNGYYWSSSEYGSNTSWILYMSNGNRGDVNKGDNRYVRSSLLLENGFDPAATNGLSVPQIGDIMYADKTWGKAANYDGSKTAVGVITHVSSDNRDVTIMSLKDLKFSSSNSVGNFNPADPFNGSAAASTNWSTTRTDINDLTNFNANALMTAVKSGEREILGEEVVVETLKADDSMQTQFNTLLNQYDLLINDSSYKGVNLLKGDSMDVTFNENGDNKLTVQGQDISASALGLNQASWTTVADVAQSLSEIRAAINTLRNVASELGNHNSIIQTRQDFTENLINLLSEGEDKLTLADMNEESANMLALQTRQQLAINALSLAAQSEQGILKLF